ncbi:hypothetical protein ACRRTK_024527 [Alexandromys fortis]
MADPRVSPTCKFPENRKHSHVHTQNIFMKVLDVRWIQEKHIGYTFNPSTQEAEAGGSL